MNEERCEIWRFLLRGAGGCVIVGFLLMVAYTWTRIPPLGFLLLLSGMLMLSGSMEPEHGWVNLALLIGSTVVSYLGSLACLIAYPQFDAWRRDVANPMDINALPNLAKREIWAFIQFELKTFGELVNCGFGVLIIGFLLGALANSVLMSYLVKEWHASLQPEEEVKVQPVLIKKKGKPTRPCPYCGKTVLKNATICNHCAMNFEKQD